MFHLDLQKFTQNRKSTKSLNTISGFTLIEIVIVLAIIAILSTAFIPKMLTSNSKNDQVIQTINDVLNTEYQLAKTSQKPQIVTGSLSSNVLHLSNGKEVTIPDVNIESAVVSGTKGNDGIEFHFFVYPDAICDYFAFTLSNDKKIEAVPLLLQTRYLPAGQEITQ